MKHLISIILVLFSLSLSAQSWCYCAGGVVCKPTIECKPTDEECTDHPDYNQEVEEDAIVGQETKWCFVSDAYLQECLIEQIDSIIVSDCCTPEFFVTGSTNATINSYNDKENCVYLTADGTVVPFALNESFNQSSQSGQIFDLSFGSGNTGVTYESVKFEYKLACIEDEGEVCIEAQQVIQYDASNPTPVCTDFTYAITNEVNVTGTTIDGNGIATLGTIAPGNYVEWSFDYTFCCNDSNVAQGENCKTRTQSGFINSFEIELPFFTFPTYPCSDGQVSFDIASLVTTNCPSWQIIGVNFIPLAAFNVANVTFSGTVVTVTPINPNFSFTNVTVQVQCTNGLADDAVVVGGVACTP